MVRRVLWTMFISATCLLMILSAKSIVATGKMSVSTDEKAINWREAEMLSRRRKRNKQRQSQRLKHLQMLNAEMMATIGTAANESNLFFRNFGGSAVSVTDKEGKLQAKCSFVAADCSMELQEQEAVAKYISESDSVLEVCIFPCFSLRV